MRQVDLASVDRRSRGAKANAISPMAIERIKALIAARGENSVWAEYRSILAASTA